MEMLPNRYPLTNTGYTINYINNYSTIIAIKEAQKIAARLIFGSLTRMRTA